MLKGTKLIAVLDAENFSPDSLPNASEIVFRPFTAAELCARILRLIAPANRIYEKNGLKIDFNNAEVSYNGELIHLTLLEYKLLALLAQNHGTVVGYKKILSSLWEYPIGNEMLSIRVFITAIRKKLAAAGANETLIVNKMGSGYMLS